MKVFQNLISVNKLEESSNIPSASNMIITIKNYSKKCAKIVQNSYSDSVLRSGLLEKVDNPTISHLNPNCENLFSSFKKPNVIINYINSNCFLSLLNLQMNFLSKETLVNK